MLLERYCLLTSQVTAAGSLPFVSTTRRNIDVLVIGIKDRNRFEDGGGGISFLDTSSLEYLGRTSHELWIFLELGHPFCRKRNSRAGPECLIENELHDG
jgi:hypothetical protein